MQNLDDLDEAMRASTYTRWVKAVLCLSAVLLAVWYALSLLPISNFVYRIFIWISVPVMRMLAAAHLARAGASGSVNRKLRRRGYVRSIALLVFTLVALGFHARRA